MNKSKHVVKFLGGQGLVEFALILPLLLFMLMGIIDFGLIFYSNSAVSNAVREAVRYGATNPTDCAGIERAARSQLTFVPASRYTVTISYDDGKNPLPFSCPPSAAQTLATTVDRVVVDVRAMYSPLTPGISNIAPVIPLSYRAARTIWYLPSEVATSVTPSASPPPPPPPVVTLSCSPISGGAPLTVVCTADAPGYTVISWSWSGSPAGQGTNVATYTFTSPGTYDIVVTASNTGGSGWASASIHVTSGPTAQFSCSTHVVNTGVEVTCTDASLNGPTSGTWNWGDGTSTPWTGVGSTVSHIYSTTGNRTIQLTVSNSIDSSTALWLIAVYTPANVTSVTCTPPSGDSPLTVNCTADVSGDVQAYLWNWGDGSTSNGYPGTHTFDVTTPSNFTVQLTVQGFGGNMSSASTTVAVAVPPVVAAFTCSPLKGSRPLTVTCTDQSLGSPTTWNWQFGDGGTSSLQNPSHMYSAVGYYTVTLTASKAAGGSTLVKPKYVTVVDLYFVSYQVCASKASGRSPITVRGTISNTLRLPMASAVMTDTTAGVQLGAYGGYRFCGPVGSGSEGDIHSSTASVVISGTTVITSTLSAAVHNATTCPNTCP